VLFRSLLAVQSKIENMPLVSADPLLDMYGINRVW
jgi:hypothetical protein